jgi:hypothetical protein
MMIRTELRDQVWDLVEDFSAPSTKNPTIFSSTLTCLQQKIAAGFPVSFNDYFGRTLAYHLVNDTRAVTDVNGPGSATLWNSIRDTTDFKSRVAPFPIVIALGRQQGEANVTIASPIVRSCFFSVPVQG